MTTVAALNTREPYMNYLGMKRFRMNPIKIALAFVIWPGFNQAIAQDVAQDVAQEETDILQIYDQFVTSSAAAGKCETPDKETLTRFLSNFQMVTLLAADKLEQQNPGSSKQSIAMTMKARSDLIANKVHELVASSGCDYPGTQEVIKRFYAQAAWQPKAAE